MPKSQDSELTLEYCQYAGDVPGHPAQALCDVGEPGEAKQGDRQVAQRGQHLRSSTGPYGAPVFIEGIVPHPPSPVLDTPVPAHQVSKLAAPARVGSQTGDEVRRRSRGGSSRPDHHILAAATVHVTTCCVPTTKRGLQRILPTQVYNTV